MCWIEVRDYQQTASQPGRVVPDWLSRKYCEHLESGQILFFPETPFLLAGDERDFLLAQRQSNSQLHKNISYRPVRDAIRGFARRNRQEALRLRSILRGFSGRATDFLARLLGTYAESWSLDFASFRPLEERGRDLPLHKRNDLLHVDAFPTRPVRGARILRFFLNINPTESRVWLTTRPFAALVEHFADDAGLPRIAARAGAPRQRMVDLLVCCGKRMGLPMVDRSAYDRFMLRFHDHLKESATLQTAWPKIRLEFPPGSAWAVFTDSVPHAVLSGQYALEQTYLVPLSAMQRPELSPLAVLERHCGRALVGGKMAATTSPPIRASLKQAA